MYYIGAFVYCGDNDEIKIDDPATHYELIEDMEDEYGVHLNTTWAMGWLYEDDDQNIYVQWSSVEYYPGHRETQERAERKLAEHYGKPIGVTEGQSQWNDGETYAKIAEEVRNRARDGWPRGYSWITSWIYLPAIDEVVMDMNYQHSHDMAIEHWEDKNGQEVNLDQSFEVGLILQADATNEYFIYPEYSDWARMEGYDNVPVSEAHVLNKVKEKAEEQGETISGIVRGDPRDPTIDPVLSKFRPKKKKRQHIKKDYMRGFHHYDGYALFIPAWYAPAQYPEGGQIDTTGAEHEQLKIPTLIKFVSLPDKFLVGEDTHHLYLLEAEYGAGEFPSDTVAIGRAALENDVITGVGFDFGTFSGQEYAIKQLRDWAHMQGYELSPNLKEDILGLASTSSL